MNEHSFIRSIHRRLPKDIYAWKIHDSYQGGVADAYYSRRGGRDIWIEYKYVPKLPKRPQTPVQLKLSELQKDWLRERHMDGRTVSVVIGSPAGSLILPGITWEREILSDEFIRNAVDTADVVAYIVEQTAPV